MARPASSHLRAAVLVTCIAMLMYSTASRAGMSWTDYLMLSGEDAIILDTDLDIVVATMLAREGGGTTKGDPPRLLLRITEVMRGEKQVDRRHAVWLPFPNDVDWIGPGSRERIANWERESLAAPPLGKKFILVADVGYTGAGPFLVSPIGRFPFDAARYDWVRKSLGRIDTLRAEAWQYAGAWYHEYTDAEVLDGARPVQDDTALEPGQPVLLNWASLWRGRVVAVLPNRRVRVRPEGEDSRWDDDEERGRLLLYPLRILQAERAAALGSPRHSRDRNGW
jgi:hypothetical protein